MEGNLIPAFGGGSATRSYSRSVSRTQQGTGMSLARIDGEVMRQEAAVEGVAAVGATAMRQVAAVSELESQLGQLVPAAVSRLQAIADMTALGMAEVVSETATRLRRAR